MSDPVIAPAAPAPVAEPAAPVAAAPAPEAPKPARVNPYARSTKPTAPVAASTPTPAAAPTPASKPKSSRVLALREAEIAKLKPVVAEHGEAMALLAPVVKDRLAALPEKARKALEVTFKDKPLALLREIQRLDEMGLLAAPAAPPPAPTAAPQGPPATGTKEVDEDLATLAKWNDLSKKSPTAAQSFYSSHRAAIARAQAKSAARN